MLGGQNMLKQWRGGRKNANFLGDENAEPNMKRAGSRVDSTGF